MLPAWNIVVIPTGPSEDGEGTQLHISHPGLEPRQAAEILHQVAHSLDAAAVEEPAPVATD